MVIRHVQLLVGNNVRPGRSKEREHGPGTIHITRIDKEAFLRSFTLVFGISLAEVEMIGLAIRLHEVRHRMIIPAKPMFVPDIIVILGPTFGTIASLTAIRAKIPVLTSAHVIRAPQMIVGVSTASTRTVRIVSMRNGPMVIRAVRTITLLIEIRTFRTVTIHNPNHIISTIPPVVTFVSDPPKPQETTVRMDVHNDGQTDPIGLPDRRVIESELFVTVQGMGIMSSTTAKVARHVVNSSRGIIDNLDPCVPPPNNSVMTPTAKADPM